MAFGTLAKSTSSPPYSMLNSMTFSSIAEGPDVRDAAPGGEVEEEEEVHAASTVATSSRKCRMGLIRRPYRGRALVGFS